jgi:hypothetical protein
MRLRCPLPACGARHRERLAVAARERHLREVHRQRRDAVCLTHVKAPAHRRRSLLMGHDSIPRWPGHGSADPLPAQPAGPWLLPSGGGGVQMTTVARLLAQKRELMDRLQGNPGPQERDEIERWRRSAQHWTYSTRRGRALSSRAGSSPSRVAGRKSRRTIFA